MESTELRGKVAHLEEQVKILRQRVEDLEHFRGTLERLLLAKWPEYEAHREEGV